jgi:hypothetical protein
VWRRWGELHDQKMILLENSKHGDSDSMGCIFVLLLVGLSSFFFVLIVKADVMKYVELKCKRWKHLIFGWMPG